MQSDAMVLQDEILPAVRTTGLLKITLI